MLLSSMNFLFWKARRGKWKNDSSSAEQGKFLLTQKSSFYAEKRPAEMETNDAPFTLTVINVKSGNNDVPQTDIMQMSGHKNVHSITRYSNVSQKQQLNMSHTLTGLS